MRLEALNSLAGSGVSDSIGSAPAGQRNATFARFAQLYAGVRVAVLAATDICALSAAGSFGYLIWARAELSQPMPPYANLFPLITLFPLIYMLMGLYPGFGLGAVETIRRLCRGTTLGFLIAAAANFPFKLDYSYSRGTFLIAWITALTLVPLLRFIVLSLVCNLKWWGEPVVILGTRNEVELAANLVESARSLGYRVAGALYRDADTAGASLATDATLEEVRRYGVEQATVIVWAGHGDSLALAQLQRTFARVVVLQPAPAMPVEQVQVRNLGGVLGIQFNNELLRTYNRAIKRTLDITVGAAMLIATAPIIALCGVAIKTLNGGPVFFSQRREGRYGRTIVVRKLRTMHRDADRRLRRYLQANPEARREWEEHMKISRDPRVIPLVGGFLRRFSLDELPQLLNVVRGEMSLVGPRPLPSYHLERFTPEFRRLRRAVRPGLTGMWQVMVRSAGSIEDQVQYDSHYIRNWSVWLDIYLLVRTICAVLSGRGAS